MPTNQIMCKFCGVMCRNFDKVCNSCFKSNKNRKCCIPTSCELTNPTNSQKQITHSTPITTPTITPHTTPSTTPSTPTTPTTPTTVAWRPPVISSTEVSFETFTPISSMVSMTESCWITGYNDVGSDYEPYENENVGDERLNDKNDVCNENLNDKNDVNENFNDGFSMVAIVMFGGVYYRANVILNYMLPISPTLCPKIPIFIECVDKGRSQVSDDLQFHESENSIETRGYYDKKTTKDSHAPKITDINQFKFSIQSSEFERLNESQAQYNENDAVVFKLNSAESIPETPTEQPQILFTQYPCQYQHPKQYLNPHGTPYYQHLPPTSFCGGCGVLIGYGFPGMCFFCFNNGF